MCTLLWSEKARFLRQCHQFTFEDSTQGSQDPGLVCSIGSNVLLHFSFLAVVQSLSHVQLFLAPWTAACQVPVSFTISQSFLKLMFIESVMPSNHLILCRPFSSCPQSFPASGSFPMSQLFASGSQSVGVSASVLPMNIQRWFPLGLTGSISLLSKGLSRVGKVMSLLFSTVQVCHSFPTKE